MHMTEDELRRLSTAEKVEMMQKKRTIGDWFLWFSIVTFLSVLAIYGTNDKTVSKMFTTFESMIPNAK